MSERVNITVSGRLSFPRIFVPEKNDQGKMKYSTAFILDEGEEAKLVGPMKKVVSDKWGKDAIAKLGKSIRPTLRLQEEKDLEGYDNPEGYFFNCSTTRKPGVLMPDHSPCIDPEEAYAGRNAMISVSPFAYEGDFGKGVSFGLNAVILQKHNDRLGGGPDAAALFADVPAQEVSAVETPTAEEDVPTKSESADIFGDEV